MSETADDAIARIKNSGSDYYKVLGVDNKADDAAIKKAYRKLALLLHPDKCKLDGAEDAFKSLSAAYNCLSSESSRRTYDMTGGENTGSSASNPFGGVDPNEIFEQFFRQNGDMGAFNGFQGMNGGQTFFFTSQGGPGFNFSAGGGHPFFTGMNRGMQSEDGSSSYPQHPPNVADLLPDYIKFFLPVYKAISQILPPQLLGLGAVVIGTMLMSYMIRFVLARLLYVVLIFSLAPSKFKWRLLLALYVFHLVDMLP